MASVPLVQSARLSFESEPFPAEPLGCRPVRSVVEELLHVAEDIGIEPLVLSLILAPLATELPEKANSFFWVRDGELLIVPQLGRLRMHTELGILDVAPGEICVIPRGLKFRVDGLQEILNWVMTWTGRGVVVSPLQLRELVAERLRTAG